MGIWSREGDWERVAALSAALSEACKTHHVSVRAAPRRARVLQVCCFDEMVCVDLSIRREEEVWETPPTAPGKSPLGMFCILVHGDLKQFVIEQTPS